MPTRLCIHPRCPNPATYRGRCPTHAKSRERDTHQNKQTYNSKRWATTRSRVLYEQPLCAIDNCDEISTDVDHIIAIEDGGNRWARHNLQGLCQPHHSQKTNAELRGRGVSHT